MSHCPQTMDSTLSSVPEDFGGEHFRPLKRFATKVERLNVRYDAFSEEFASILQRQAHVDEV